MSGVFPEQFENGRGFSPFLSPIRPAALAATSHQASPRSAHPRAQFRSFHPPRHPASPFLSARPPRLSVAAAALKTTAAQHPRRFSLPACLCGVPVAVASSEPRCGTPPLACLPVCARVVRKRRSPRLAAAAASSACRAAVLFRCVVLCGDDTGPPCVCNAADDTATSTASVLRRLTACRATTLLRCSNP